jgi:hypothetical protein
MFAPSKRTDGAFPPGADLFFNHVDHCMIGYDNRDNIECSKLGRELGLG